MDAHVTVTVGGDYSLLCEVNYIVYYCHHGDNNILVMHIRLKNETRWSACYYAYLAASKLVKIEQVTHSTVYHVILSIAYRIQDQVLIVIMGLHNAYCILRNHSDLVYC